MAKVNEYIPVHYVGRRTPVRVNTGPETRVEQCHQETTNINRIIARYRTSGVLPENRPGRYEDVSEVGEFMDVRLQMNAAMQAYEDLPNSITDQFNDVGEFLEYAERQRQADALRSEPSDSGDNPTTTGGVSPPESPPADPPSDPPTTGKDQA